LPLPGCRDHQAGRDTDSDRRESQPGSARNAESLIQAPVPGTAQPDRDNPGQDHQLELESVLALVEPVTHMYGRDIGEDSGQHGHGQDRQQAAADEHAAGRLRHSGDGGHQPRRPEALTGEERLGLVETAAIPPAEQLLRAVKPHDDEDDQAQQQ
jgi:hypothetical protein